MLQFCFEFHYELSRLGMAIYIYIYIYIYMVELTIHPASMVFSRSEEPEVSHI